VPIVGAFGLAWFRRPDDYSVAVLMIMFLIMFIASFTKKHEPSAAMKA
jgi:hypothetical protein